MFPLVRLLKHQWAALRGPLPSICGYDDRYVPYGKRGLTSKEESPITGHGRTAVLCRISTLISRLKASSVVTMAVAIRVADVLAGEHAISRAGIRSQRSAARHLSLLPRSCDHLYGAKYRGPG